MLEWRRWIETIGDQKNYRRFVGLSLGAPSVHHSEHHSERWASMVERDEAMINPCVPHVKGQTLAKPY